MLSITRRTNLLRQCARFFRIKWYSRMQINTHQTVNVCNWTKECVCVYYYIEYAKMTHSVDFSIIRTSLTWCFVINMNRPTWIMVFSVLLPLYLVWPNHYSKRINFTLTYCCSSFQYATCDIEIRKNLLRHVIMCEKNVSVMCNFKSSMNEQILTIPVNSCK